MSTVNNLSTLFLTLFGFEKAKGKMHVLLIVLIHMLGWCVFFFLPVLLYPVRVNNPSFILFELIDKSVLVLFFYVNYYWLIPRFFMRRKRVMYFSLTLLAFVLYLVQHAAVRSHFMNRQGPPFQFVQSVGKGHRWGFNGPMIVEPARQGVVRPGEDGMMVPEPVFLGMPRGFWVMTLNNAVGSFLLLALMGGFIRLAYSFLKNQNEKKMLENANLNAEVNFLKSQINPHFLFNTLNSIYAQAHSRSDHTEFSILKLSELLRYVLYDSGGEKVPLENDIRYVTNYVDLQKIRLSSKVTIRYDVRGNLQGKVIAPLLLITFIENAFKHGISYTQASTVHIDISAFQETLTLHVSNPVIEKNSFVSGGLGLKNVTRRLDLLYPGKYQLEIHQDDGLHIVNLKIDLKND